MAHEAAEFEADRALKVLACVALAISRAARPRWEAAKRSGDWAPLGSRRPKLGKGLDRASDNADSVAEGEASPDERRSDLRFTATWAANRRRFATPRPTLPFLG